MIFYRAYNGIQKPFVPWDSSKRVDKGRILYRQSKEHRWFYFAPISRIKLCCGWYTGLPSGVIQEVHIDDDEIIEWTSHDWTENWGWQGCYAKDVPITASQCRVRPLKQYRTYDVAIFRWLNVWEDDSHLYIQWYDGHATSSGWAENIPEWLNDDKVWEIRNHKIDCTRPDSNAFKGKRKR